MVNNRILINSAPRSATTWLQFILYHHKITSLNINNIKYGPDIYSPAFIIRSHVPVTLLAKFDDITQTTILRDPLDLIPSIVTKTAGGLRDSVISGIPQPIERDYANLESLIMDKFTVYKNYAHGIEKNIKNLKPFTFDQVTLNIEYVVKHLLGLEADNKNIDNLKKSAKKTIKVYDKGDLGLNNALPVDKKPDLYYKVKDMLLNNTEFDEIQKIYEDSKSLILDEQSIW
ncbi:MAG: hypothetical protein RLZZ425_115 [Bacteroidota bacterium]